MTSRVANFDEWWESHPEVQEYVEPIKGSTKWVKLNCKYQKKGDKTTKVYKAILCVDPNSKYAGNIYSNDLPIILFVKFIGTAMMVRPMHTILCLAYSILGIRVAVAIVESFKKKEPIDWIARQALHSVEDVFRIPYYETILSASAIVAVVAGPFKSSLFYDCRAFTGYMQSKFFRGEKSELVGTPCMYRVSNITFYEKLPQKLIGNVVYIDEDNPVLVGLTNLAFNSL